MNAMGRLVDGLALPQPYLLFLGDTTEPGYAKTAFGLVDWARDRCVAEFALPESTVSAGLPRLAPADAHAAGARALVIGVANQGGFISPRWVAALVEALEALLADQTLVDAFGNDFVNYLVRIKRAEWARYEQATDKMEFQRREYFSRM